LGRMLGCAGLLLLAPAYRVGCECAPGGSPIEEDAGPDGGTDAGRDASYGPVTFAQAVPGTAVYQVMQNVPSQSQTISLDAGDLLVAIAYGGQGPGSPTPTTAPNIAFAVSDSQGNAYFAGPLVESSRSHQSAIQIFFAPNVRGGPTTVTFTSSVSPPGLSLWTGLFLQEYSGMAARNVADVSSARMAPGLTTDVSPGPVTTTAECDLVVAAFTDGNIYAQALDAGAGWTFRSTDLWDPGAAVDNLPGCSPAGSVVDGLMDITSGAPQHSSPVDDGWVAAQIALRASGTTEPPQPAAVAFATQAMTAPRGTCAGPVMLESRIGTQAVRSATGLQVALSAPGLSLHVDPTCRSPVSSVFIGAGTSSTGFYFLGADAGAWTITATTPGLSGDTQVETVP
jgi:hypothetical protein